MRKTLAKELAFCAAAILIVIAAYGSALAETLTCSTSVQGYHVCQGPGGYRSTETPWQGSYRSTETPWQGMTVGKDNQGDRWTTSRWRDIDITTIEPR